MNCIRSFTDLTEQKQLHYESAYQKDTKEGNKKIQEVVITGQDPTQLRFLFMFAMGSRFLSSKSSWDRGSLGTGPGRVVMVISGQSYCLCLYFLSLSKNEGLGSWNAYS